MTYKKKLIEVAIPLDAINKESAREKSIRHGHPSTLHLWWARRPLAAARAVLFAQLVDDPSSHPDRFPTEEDQHLERKRLFEIMERLVPWEASTDQQVLAEAHAEIVASCDGDLPKVLDPFGGGGAIPLESLRLGLPTYSGDLNPVAVLIQRAMIEIPQRFTDRPPANPDVRGSRNMWNGAEGLAADVQAYGKWMQEEARRRIGHHYPDVELPDGTTATPIAWIWARTVKSPDPSWPGHVPLVRSWELAKRPGKPVVWIEPIVDRESKTITYEIREGGTPGKASVERGNGTCIATGTPIPGAYIKAEANAGRMGAEMIAIVAEGQRGRVYSSAQDAARVAEIEVPASAPRGAVAMDPRNIWVTIYGFDDWWKLFTPRQLVALTTFSDLLPEVRQRVIADVGGPAGARLRDGGSDAEAYADAVVTYLAFAIDKATNLWSSVVTWMNDRGAFRETFARQAIPMTWDFAEANPFSSSGGGWALFIDKIARAVAALPTGRQSTTAQRDARARIAEVGPCVIATDPPYYDNISYADLADFFYVWMRRNLKDVWPDECATLLTPKVEELIANRYRAGSIEAANLHFELGMQGVFSRAAENADDRFPATIFYAFKASERDEDGVASAGWATFLTGLLTAGYVITATWPVRTESPGRMIASGTNALASSIVLAARKRQIDAPMATRGEFVAALRREMPSAIRLLQEQNIAPVDMAQSAIGPGIGVFSRYARVVEAGGEAMTVRTALALINEVLAEVISGEEAELDPDSRFALTWFEQYGHNPGPSGAAITLATAKNTTLDGVVRSGVAVSRDGKVRLAERAELDPHWDPMSDKTLTTWEITQHLIIALDRSEAEAAALLKRVGGGMGERARQLAYLLYQVCDRKSWAKEADPYNRLVSAWTELEKLVATGVGASDAQQQLTFAEPGDDDT